MNEVIKTLQEWRLYADNGHNDGWTRKHYEDKIKEVKSYLLVRADIHKEIEEYFNERPDWDADLPPYAKMEQIKKDMLEIVDDNLGKTERPTGCDYGIGG